MSTIFPKAANKWPTLIAMGGGFGAVCVIGLVWYYFTPKFWRSGYMPSQPSITVAYEADLRAWAQQNSKQPEIPGETFPGFSHQIHAGKLAMDCRYCHSHVEESAEANIPAVSTCIGCHAENHVNDQMYAKAERVKFIRDAWAKDEPIYWRRVHKLPDYVRNFPHNTHVQAGVSCLSCHGNIMEQPVVRQSEPLSMGWCLDCHRNPTPNLVPKDKVTDLYWVREQIKTEAGDPSGNPKTSESPGGEALLESLKTREGDLHILPANCGACHY